MRFDHAGIATDDADGLAELFCELFDCEIAHREHFDGMCVVFLDFGNDYFELLEPDSESDSKGAIATYLDRHGPGIHHLALTTGDIDGALERAAEMGIERIDAAPRSGAWGHRVAFLHPKSTGGVLIEFVEH